MTHHEWVIQENVSSFTCEVLVLLHMLQRLAEDQLVVPSAFRVVIQVFAHRREGCGAHERRAAAGLDVCKEADDCKTIRSDMEERD